MRVQVQEERLCFRAKPESSDSESPCTLLNVELFDVSASSELRAVGHGETYSSTLEDLCVDCRATPQDDPKAVKLLGALLCDGRRTSRLLAEQSRCAAGGRHPALD